MFSKMRMNKMEGHRTKKCQIHMKNGKYLLNLEHLLFVLM